LQYYNRGKRIRESTGSTDHKAAQQQLTQRLNQIDKGEYIERPIKPVAVAELYEELEREYRRQGRRSLRSLKLRWKHLSVFFGQMTAANLTKEMIDRYRDARLVEGAARSTVNREVAALKTAIYLGAEKLPKLPVFPTQLAENNRRTGFVEEDEYAKLSGNVSQLWLRMFLELAYRLGWRKSEILGLRVRQVDLKSRTIRLDPGTTKNGEGREGHMTPRIYQLAREAVHDKRPDDFLLTRKGNRRVLDFRQAWEKLCAGASLEGLLVHDLRRSAARNLRRAGVAESVVMEIGGWKTRSVFLRYDIVNSKDRKRAMEQLEQQRLAHEQARTENGHSFSHNSVSEATEQAEPQNARIN